MIAPKEASGMFRFIGRILIAIAAGLLLYSGITGIINGVHTIQNAGGWDAFFNSGNFLVDMFGLIIAIGGSRIGDLTHQPKTQGQELR